MGKYIKGQDRKQLVLFGETIEERISESNPIRVIDLYIESLDLESMGFARVRPKNKGTNSYDPKDMLRLYMYGYKNGIRSSRKLSWLCETNIEVMWLMRELRPDFRTISDFRKDNIKSLKKVFKDMVIMCTELGIVGNEYSQDGVKIEAVNSKERNYTLNKIDDKIKRIEERIEKYLKEIEEVDKIEGEREEKLISKGELEKRLKERKEKKKELEKIREEMESTGSSQVSLTDKESRLMKNNGKFSVCYNNQVAVDTKSHIVVNYQVDNKPSDTGSMNDVIKEAKEITGKKIVKNITDKGYNDRKDMAKCLEEGIIPEVTLPEGKENYEIEIEYEKSEVSKEEIESERKEDIKKVLRSGRIPKVYEEYIEGIEVVEKIEYEREEIKEKIEEMEEEEIRDYAIDNECLVRDIKRNKVYCKEGEILRQKSKNSGRKKYCNKEACKHCKNPCTRSKYKEAMFSEGQVISGLKGVEKSYPQGKKKRKKRKVVRFKLKPKEEDLRIRKQTSEHPHGSMKRSDNASYFLLKGKEKVNGEMALYYIGYNLRRLINIKGVEELKEYLEERIKKREEREEKKVKIGQGSDFFYEKIKANHTHHPLHKPLRKNKILCPH